ncbi:hypothetical protein H4I95_02697 [Botrytis cinerea]
MKFPITLLTLSTLLPLISAATSAKFSLLSKSTYTPYNNVHFGSVGSVSGTLVAGLQPFQTLPVGGTINNGVLSFIGWIHRMMLSRRILSTAPREAGCS